MNRKYILICLLVCISNIISATDYFISSSDAAANDLNDGTSPTTPWKSISKVNSVFSSLKPGDKILFKRKDIFYGTIKITKSGTTGLPITISAYGEGDNPVITGFNTLTGWNDEGNGIRSGIIVAESSTNMVIVDNIQYAIGRYPNKGTNLIYESHSGKNIIVDNQLSSTINWKGAEVVINKNDWTLDRCLITEQSGTSITYSNLGGIDEPENNRYYFIQNDIRTLDVFGEWFYNKTEGKLYMYFGTTDPSLKEIKVATLNNLVSNNGFDFITIEGLNFIGSISDGISFKNSCDYCAINNCNIRYTGLRGIDFTGAQGLIKGNFISNTNWAGIFKESSIGGSIIIDNTIQDVGLIPGQSFWGTYNLGIYVTDINCLVQYNTVERIGYDGIHISGGSKSTVKNNFINYPVLLLNDGGGIYTPGNTTVRTIEGNIVLNAGVGGSASGTILIEGIYVDAWARNVVVKGNTIANCRYSGIKNNLGGNNTYIGNTCFNNKAGIYLAGDGKLNNTILNNNIFFAKETAQITLRFFSQTDDIQNFGTADENYYTRPIDDDDVIYTYSPSIGSKTRTISGWQSFTGQDLNSHKSPIAITDVNTILFEYNASKTDKIVTLSKPMIDVTGKKYTGSVTLAPYTSIILLVDPNPAQTMTPVYQSSVIENTTPSILTMTYDQTLANVIPLASAFKVIVNSSERTVTKVSISGTKVQLTLASPVVHGDKVTVEYSKPPSNPFLQATSGDPAESIPAQNVTNNVNPPNPVYVSSVVENTTPSRIEITYNLSLKTVSISPSAFAVKVNTITRTVSSVSISGTKVLLNLASPVAYGDLVTVAYTKPATNFIQTPDGGQAVSFTAKTVTNNVSPAAPVYVSSVIEDATPSLLEMTFNMSLTNIVPVNSAFTVTINSSVSSLISVSVSGTKVNLNLANPAKFGDIVTVAYSKPASGQLQASSGAQVASFTAQPVTNNCTDPAQTLFPPVILTNYEPNAFSGKVYEIDASGSTDANNDILTFSWSAPSNVDLSSNSGSKIRFLAPVVITAEVITIGLSVSDGTTVQSKNLPVNILPYKPDLAMGKVDIVEASNSYSTDYPDKAIDGDPDTKWSMEGDNNWLRFDMPLPFKISHLLLSFLPDQNFESYFDIYASGDKKSWEPVLLNAKSCDFSGGPQVFDFPVNKTSTDYTSVKLVGHGNSLNSWNYFSEFKLFGSPGEAPDTISVTPEKIYIYPNPASEFINVLVLEPFEKAQNLRIIDFSGRLCQEILLEPGLNNIKVPLNLKPGIYITQVILGKLITFSQKLLVSH